MVIGRTGPPTMADVKNIQRSFPPISGSTLWLVLAKLLYDPYQNQPRALRVDPLAGAGSAPSSPKNGFCVILGVQSFGNPPNKGYGPLPPTKKQSKPL